MIGRSSTERYGEVYRFTRPYELGLPDCDVQWIVILESSILEGPKVLKETWLEKPML